MKWYNLLFDLENVHAESIIPLLESRKSYAKCIDHLFESRKGYAKRHDLFLIRKMVMKNDIFGISVGAYCIRPLRMSPKGTYD